MFECVVGKVPYASETSRERILRLATSKKPPPVALLAPRLPKILADVLERALEPGPTRRFQTAAKIEHAIEDAERAMR